MASIPASVAGTGAVAVVPEISVNPVATLSIVWSTGGFLGMCGHGSEIVLLTRLNVRLELSSSAELAHQSAITPQPSGSCTLTYRGTDLSDPLTNISKVWPSGLADGDAVPPTPL
jgi:hypothetical protein